MYLLTENEPPAVFLMCVAGTGWYSQERSCEGTRVKILSRSHRTDSLSAVVRAACLLYTVYIKSQVPSDVPETDARCTTEPLFIINFFSVLFLSAICEALPARRKRACYFSLGRGADSGSADLLLRESAAASSGDYFISLSLLAACRCLQSNKSSTLLNATFWVRVCRLRTVKF